MWTGALAAADLGSAACGINKSSWRRSPLALPYSCPANDPQTGGQLYQRSSHTFAKDPHKISQPGGLEKGLRSPREFDFEGQQDLITELPQTGKTNYWRAQTKPCVPQKKGAVTPSETESDFSVSAQESEAEA